MGPVLLARLTPREAQKKAPPHTTIYSVVIRNLTKRKSIYLDPISQKRLTPMEALKTISPQIYRFTFTCYYKQVVIPLRQQRVAWPAILPWHGDEGETRPRS